MAKPRGAPATPGQARPAATTSRSADPDWVARGLGIAALLAAAGAAMAAAAIGPQAGKGKALNVGSLDIDAFSAAIDPELEP